MTDFFHEFQWQGKHMHTFHFKVNAQGETYCPSCGDIYRKRTKKPMSAPFIAAWLTVRRIQNEEQERLNSLTTNTTTTNKVTLPEPPKQEVSRLAQISFLLIFAALGSLISTLMFLAAGIGVAALVGVLLCGFSLLTSISLGILSLRENL